MPIVPTHKTAMLAGAWTSLGVVPFEAWMNHRHMTVLENNVISLGVMLIFLFLPFLYLVLGRDNDPFTRTWFMDPEQRARYWVISKRMMSWMLGAIMFGIPWSLILGFVIEK